MVMASILVGFFSTLELLPCRFIAHPSISSVVVISTKSTADSSTLVTPTSHGLLLLPPTPHPIAILSTPLSSLQTSTLPTTAPVTMASPSSSSYLPYVFLAPPALETSAILRKNKQVLISFLCISSVVALLISNMLQSESLATPVTPGPQPPPPPTSHRSISLTLIPSTSTFQIAIIDPTASPSTTSSVLKLQKC